jgi:protein ImuA
MSRNQSNISALRQRIARLDPASDMAATSMFALGAERIDARLGGGLACAALHEVFAAQEEEASAAAAFAIILALRAMLVSGDATKPILWIRDDRAERRCGRLYGPGLVELGVDPDRLILVNTPDELSTLRAGADGVKCGAVGAVVIEPYGKVRALDLTATRRLSLAAAASGVLTLLLRVAAEPAASAAQTRWRVAAAPSVPLAANAPGTSAFDVALLRHRSGIAGFETRLEWNRDQHICVEGRAPETAISRFVSAPAVFGTDQAKAA